MLIEELVNANHILFKRGVVDGFGHISARHPKRADAFLMARSMAPALVGQNDIMALGFDGAALDGDVRQPYLERFIHGSIYAARPDVGAIVHSHSPAVIPFGVAQGATLRPVSHMSGFLGDGAPVFEIRSTAGPATDMLVRNATIGDALAASLGSSAVILMRGHGSTTVGGNIRQAVFRAVYTEVNARLQAEALRLGPVTFLSAQEAELSAAVNDEQIDRIWSLWLLERSPLSAQAHPEN